MKFLAVVVATVLLVTSLSSADSHPTFTAAYLRNNSDLLVIGQISKIRRVDRPVDNPVHERAYEFVVTVLDSLKGNPPTESILIAHLRTDYSNKIPIDFGDTIDQKLIDLDIDGELDLSGHRLYVLAYLKAPAKAGGVYTPVSTSNWEHYSFHLLSGQYNLIKAD